MSDIMHLMEMDWRNGVLFVAAIIIVIVFILQKTDWLIEKIGIKSRRQLAEEKQDRDIKELNDHAKRSDENFDKIFHSINNVKDSINTLSQQVGDMQSRAAENEAARIKDRVAQAYRYYHSVGKITRMEKDALEENIKAYSQYSDNSFIHSVVEKELPTWIVVDE